MTQDLAYLKLLFWLKSRLLWRTYTRNTSSIIGVLGIVLGLGPFSLMVAGGLWAGFHFLQVPERAHLLRGALLGAYLLWMLAPLMGYALTEDFDLSKLLLFPISPQQMLLGAISGSLLDFGFLLLVPMLLVVVISFSTGLLGFVLVLLTLALFLFHTLALSQALNFAAAGVLRSRRGREAMMVVMMLCAMSVYVVTQFGARHAVRAGYWQHLTDSAAWRAVGFTPPGLAAYALAAVGQGRFLPALEALVPLFALCVGSLYLAAWVVRLVHSGEVITPARRPRQAPAPARPMRVAAARATTSLFGVRLPPAMQAVVDKEVRLLSREPIFRFTLLNVAYMLVIGIFMARGFSRAGDEMGGFFSSIGLWFATGFVFMIEANVLSNMFGIEGFAATTLFLFPASRRQILLGKNLTYFLAFSVVNVLVAVVIAVVGGMPEKCGALALWMELALVVFTATGNILSILFPFRLAMRGWRIQPQSVSKNMTYGLVALLGTGATGIILLPVLAAIVIPTYFVGAVWFALTLPAAAAYAVGLYLLSLWFSEHLLLQREMELAQQLSETE